MGGRRPSLSAYRLWRNSLPTRPASPARSATVRATALRSPACRSAAPAPPRRVGFEGAPAHGGWRGALTLAGNFAGFSLAGTARVEFAAGGGLAFPEVDL